tara:strand:- start:583 stop:768 length:186 start_codon:yes stop_codon:yes gene_type:complete
LKGVNVKYYLKRRGGDPRNHSWREVADYDFNKANKEDYFKKEVDNAEQGSKNKEDEKKKVK